jgi:DNA primase large subunit
MPNYNAYGLVYKYPWLDGGQEIFDPPSESNEQEDAVQYYNRLFSKYFNSYPQLQEELIKIFSLAIEKKETGVNLVEDEFNVILFYTIKTLLAAFDNRILENHVANLLSKIYYKMILNETNQNLEVLGYKMDFECHFEKKAKTIGNVMYPFWVEVHNYVPIAALLKDASYQLINQNVQNGRVYLLKDNVARLLQEIIRRHIIPDRQKTGGELMELLMKISNLSPIITKISKKMEEKKLSQIQYNTENIYENLTYALYPPCIKYILNKATNGVNLTHSERLHIAFFYANTNHTVEETIDVFRTLPDFDEKIARYNVEFSRGIGGKGKKYSVFSCAKLRSIKICKADDKDYGDIICAEGVFRKGHSNRVPIKSPKDYVFWKNVEIKRNLKNQPQKK